MRALTLIASIFLVLNASAAELESRVLTHYIPQDFLETAVRTENWTEVNLNLKGGLVKGDTIRIWAGGSIDRGNGDQPSQYVAGPAGESNSASGDSSKGVLSPQPDLVYALLFKTEGAGIKKCAVPGKPLEIPVTKNREKLFIGFNDEKGRFYDNHLGKGRRHELDPLWVRIEVVRTIVD